MIGVHFFWVQISKYKDGVKNGNLLELLLHDNKDFFVFQDCDAHPFLNVFFSEMK